jgi:hypothetical protein
MAQEATHSSCDLKATRQVSKGRRQAAFLFAAPHFGR